jgi:polysaccharide biosynthesis/export protein
MKRKSAAIPVVVSFLIFYAAVSLGSANDASYLLGTGDVLEISVWKDESLSREVTVPPDCVLSFPLVGDINVKNMTVSILRETVRKKLTEYVPEATVTVILKETNSLRAFVVGKINNPGQFAIGFDTTVMQVLSMAGGLNAYADGGKINILRQSDGQTLKIPFDYQQVSKGEKLEQNIVIQRGDVVVVP